MAILTVNQLALAGTAPTFVAAAALGDAFINSGKTFLVVKNGGAGSIDVTIDSQTACNQGFDHNVVKAVAAGAEAWIGPLQKSRFNDADGKVQVAYSGVGTVTVAAVELP